MKFLWLLLIVLSFNVFAERYIINVNKTHYKNSIVVNDKLIQDNNDNLNIPDNDIFVIPKSNSSCLTILESGLSNGDGVYEIENNGKNYDVYCDMTSGGGGWTLIVAQFETNPVKNWNEGIQKDYNPSLKNKKSFTLNTEEIPEHNQISFSKNFKTLTSYANYHYTTGDIPKTILDFIWFTGEQYLFHIHRETNSYYLDNDPEWHYMTEENFFNGYFYDSNNWINTLTINAVGYYGSAGQGWAFSPNHKTKKRRGYSFAGNYDYFRNDKEGWLLWVR